MTENANQCLLNINKAIQLNPQFPLAYIVKGGLLIIAWNNYNEGIKYFEYAVQLEPNNNNFRKLLFEAKMYKLNIDMNNMMQNFY